MEQLSADAVRFPVTDEFDTHDSVEALEQAIADFAGEGGMMLVQDADGRGLAVCIKVVGFAPLDDE